LSLEQVPILLFSTKTRWYLLRKILWVSVSFGRKWDGMGLDRNGGKERKGKWRVREKRGGEEKVYLL
jgi:hypothetical protein